MSEFKFLPHEKEREVEFRAWQRHTDTLGEMRYVSLREMFDWHPSNWVNDSIWMQFIGIRDRNGQKIYEDDLVLYSRIGYDEPLKLRVRFVDGAFLGVGDGWETHFKNIKQRPLYRLMGDELVIGNVYENPELL